MSNKEKELTERIEKLEKSIEIIKQVILVEVMGNDVIDHKCPYSKNDCEKYDNCTEHWENILFGEIK